MRHSWWFNGLFHAIAPKEGPFWALVFSKGGRIMSTTGLIILIVVLFLVFGGGGGYWYSRRRL
jgi:hypothetical protein